MDLVLLGELGDAGEALRCLGALSGTMLPGEYRTPLTLRLRLKDAGDDTVAAETEVRSKLRIPRRSIAAGPAAMSGLAMTTVTAFESVLASPELVAERFLYSKTRSGAPKARSRTSRNV